MERTKYDIRIEQQFMYTLNKCVETFPQYTISQHLLHFLRKKTESNAAYNWSNEKTLSKVEEYYDELINELASGGFAEYED